SPSRECSTVSTEAPLNTRKLRSEYSSVGKNFLKKVFPHTPFQKLLYWIDRQSLCRFPVFGGIFCFKRELSLADFELNYDLVYIFVGFWYTDYAVTEKVTQKGCKYV
ncbi:MAG: hypothetical protein IJW81_06050, partial [Clostridia bacterium]|nr:hypothetical protein [Clostridia bacterium]